MLKLKSEAHISMSRSQRLRANIDFLELAMEANLPHLERIKNVAVKSCFDQNNEIVPGSNDDTALTTLSPSNNNDLHNHRNGDVVIPLNQADLLLSLSSKKSINDHFHQRS